MFVNERQVSLVNAEQMKDFIVTVDTKLVEAMQKIDDNSKGIVFVVDAKKHLCGALTDGDVRRWLLKTGLLETEISILMTKIPKYLDRDNQGNAQNFMKENVINAVPIVDFQMQIVDIIFSDDETNILCNKDEFLVNVSVIVMAGGKGTRLYPYTKILPKPLIPIGDIPIIERIISRFTNYGITDFLLTVNYRKNMIRSYFSDIEKHYKIDYIEEDKPLGTAGSIKLITRVFERPLFVTNCDILIRVDYSALYQFHLESKNAITIVAAMKNDIIPYGVIYAKENGEVENIVEKPYRSYFVNTGMYIINPNIIDLIPEDTIFHMTDLIDKAIKAGHKVGMYPVSEDSFLDMGELEELKHMEEKLNI